MGLERDLRRTLGVLFSALRATGDQSLWPALPDRSSSAFRDRAAALVFRLKELGVTPPEGLRGVPKPPPPRRYGRGGGGGGGGRGGPARPPVIVERRNRGNFS